MIEFISSEEFPDDPYTKEVVYIKVNNSDPVAYCKKIMKNGNKFWSCMSTAIIKNGEKKFYNAIEIDSNMQKKAIIEFLEQRSWENKAGYAAASGFQYPLNVSNNSVIQVAKPQHLGGQILNTSLPYVTASTPSQQTSFLDECPF